MPFPVVQATATTNVGSGTSATVNLPAGIQSGDMLVISAVWNGSTSTQNWPAGWTTLFTDTGNGHSAAYRRANGSEGLTINVTWTTARNSHWRSFRASPVHSTQNPESSNTGGASGEPDPSNLAPSWGAAQNLWIAVGHTHSAASVITAYPTGYTDNQSDVGYTGAFRHASATRALLASSDDPSIFDFGATNAVWEAGLIAVRGSLPQTAQGHIYG